MKSFVMNIWINTWKKLYGESVVNSLIEEFKVDTSKLIIPTLDVPDDLVFQFSKKLAQRVGKAYEELWEETGKTMSGHFRNFTQDTSKRTTACRF